MGHEAEPGRGAASPSAAASWEPACPEASVSLGSGSSYLPIVSCSLPRAHTGLAGVRREPPGIVLRLR